MNSEHLSDGLLFESLAAWKEALSKDPDAVLESLIRARKALEEKLARLDLRLTFGGIDEMIETCRTALETLLAKLPESRLLFPDEKARRAAAFPVCRFLLQIDPLKKKVWELLCALSDWEAHSSLLQNETTRLFAEIISASALSEGLAIAPKLEAEKERIETILCDRIFAQNEEKLRKENLLALQKVFFGDFAATLSNAADLEEDGKSASPETIKRLCGEAKLFLASLS